jgi:protocatechuate 3,4-dioxygenase beta subunit
LHDRPILNGVLRTLVCLGGVALIATVGSTMAAEAQSGCRPTMNDGAGPFTRLDAPRRAKIGTGHVLQGRVLGAGDCSPVRGALVYLWQAGPNGYGARGRASVKTDRQGRFRFEGPVPSSYGREPHIHIAVIHPLYEELLTRHVVRRGAKSGRIVIVLTPLL